jgi:hypothetical protein
VENMVGYHLLASDQEFSNQGIGVVFVDVREVDAEEICAAKMIETINLCGNILDNITQVVPSGQLRHSQRHELRPPGCSAERTTGMVLVG